MLCSRVRSKGTGGRGCAKGDCWFQWEKSERAYCKLIYSQLRVNTPPPPPPQKKKLTQQSPTLWATVNALLLHYHSSTARKADTLLFGHTVQGKPLFKTGKSLRNTCDLVRVLLSLHSHTDFPVRHHHGNSLLHKPELQTYYNIHNT